jgi:hypothetical protein
LYYNTINVYGAAMTSTSYSTSVFFRYASSTHILKNNIFTNNRVAGSSIKHYVMNYSVITGSCVTDYNDLYTVAGTTVYICNWGGSDKTFAQWQTLGLDSHSKNTNPTYVSSSNLHIISDATISNAGTPVSVTTDIDGMTRGNPPEMGINEFPTNYKLWIGGQSNDWNTSGNWNPSGVPVSTDVITISKLPPFQPVINITNAVCANLGIGIGSTMTLNQGSQITVSGNLIIGKTSKLNNLGKIILKGNLENQNP